MKQLVVINRVLALPIDIVERVEAIEDQEDGTIDITSVRDGVALVTSVSGIEFDDLVAKLNEFYRISQR